MDLFYKNEIVVNMKISTFEKIEVATNIAISTYL